MLLSLTELQEMIESSVLEFLTHEYDFLKRANSLHAPHAIAQPIWQGFADMGWLGLPLSEADGGIDGHAMESGLLMRAFGRHLVVEPYLSSVLLGTRLLAEFGSAKQRESWLPSLLDGTRRLVLAHEEFGNSDPWAPRATRAREEAGGFILNGKKSLVAGAPGASAVLLSAQLDGGAHALFVLPLDTPGLSVTERRTLDSGRAADLTLEGVQVAAAAKLGDAGDVTPVLERILAEAIVNLCWEASGAMQAALEQTAAYTKERMQFGQSISKFQVVQHRLAEMAVGCEEALSACQLAALRIDSDPASARAMAAMAKSKVGRGALLVAKEAVQLHGAMGVSEELAIASYFRKLQGFSQQFGGAAWFAERYGEHMLDSNEYRASRTLLTQKGIQHAS
ncbi:acyl-CoA dehydrogenase family protein [Noviherbaspirillum sedimenti]|uniref:Acyl-CoA dehydrogenase n=1 Tax=Noviherbaspirillum sedimenti TaxID=2320865 RepID=A0A3A3G5Y7_9BURK|nr:acyl-CoA dehydrogenase family protein [Noviherbaspirillum sedimenti]RJG03351.1 acyl-CoA dehydrogenase [Noviherbaspirillum sedimenti]